MKKALDWFISEESGQGLVEYGLIIALVAVVVIGVLASMGDGIKGIFTEVTGKLVVPEGD